MGAFKSARKILLGARTQAKHADNTTRFQRASRAIRTLFPKSDLPPVPPKPEPKPEKVGNLPASFIALQRVRQQSAHGPQFGINQCRLRCRLALGTASVGDFDGDGAADAEDGWKAAKHKHPGDRRPPRGYPVFWLGGSNDNGHEALSAGVPDGKVETHIWSTDIRRAGFFDLVPLSEIEERWGLTYAGWAEDDAGKMIRDLV